MKAQLASFLRMSAAPTLLIVVLFGTLFYSFQLSSERRYDGLIVNLAGRQRLLNQLHLNALLAGDPAPEEARELRNRFQKRASLLLRGGIWERRSGERVPLPPAPTETIEEHLQEQINRMTVLGRLADRFVQAGRTPDIVTALRSEVRKLRRATDETTDLYEAHFETLQAWTALGKLVAEILVVCLALSLFWFVHNVVRTNRSLEREIVLRREKEAELTRHEGALKKARDVAEQASLTKSQFLANMSHELRTPLNSVIGFTNILLKNKKETLDERDLNYLQRILRNGRHLLALINDVLDLSRIEAQKLTISKERVCLPTLIQETMHELEGQLGEREDLRFEHVLPDGLRDLHTDPARLRQILVNLVGNALKFTEEGRITVRVVANGKGRTTAIEVEDTGIGIPDERLEVIFDAFQQANPAKNRKFEGTGLGLAICTRLCDLLGFDLEVESEVGVGSLFRLKIPVEASELPMTRPVLPDPVIPLLERAGDERPRVLVIEDDLDARTLLLHLFEELGCEVLAASSGDQGLWMAREFEPTLITLDLLMPGMDGWQVLRHLRINSKLASIPVVVISNVAEENDSLRLDVSTVLQKPVAHDDLLQLVPGSSGRDERKRILVVDDKSDDRALLRENLATPAVEIRTAVNGRDALKLLETYDPDLIVLDLNMPVMNGSTFLTHLRQDSRLRDIPVAIVTSAALNTTETAALRRDAEAVLQKDEKLGSELKRVSHDLLSKGRVGAGEGEKTV